MRVLLYAFALGLCLVGCQRGTTSDDPLSKAATDGPYAGMVLIPGGTFYMGGDDGEMGGNSTSHQTAYPIHETYVDAFWMDETEVTNRQFNEFVEATDYVTFAEKPLPEEALKELQMMAEMNLRDLNHQAERATGEEKEAILDSIKRIEEASQVTEYAGAIVFTLPEDRVYGMNDITQWWRLVSGATWRAPEGPGSTWKGREDHPVVNVTYEDAAAYAEWAGKRLPTEAEWERAARGGLDRQPYAWGAEFAPHGEDTWMANIWQGEWPHENVAKDGYTGSSPVKSFPPNPFGLYDIAGNVWEIVSDYYHPYAYSLKEAGAINPQGPSLDMVTRPGQRVTVRISRGGSFLCSDVWCKGYQPGSRQPFDSESPSNHTGFRCVKDVVEHNN